MQNTLISSEFSHLRFLVVDDNAHMRRIVRTMLNAFGSRDIYEAEDGVRGLELFTHWLPDIIITDLVMPVYDGIALAKMIRQPGCNANPHIPIIMLTCHTEKSHVVAARDAGVTEFLAKPVSAKALYQRIRNIIANPRPFIKSKTYFGPDRQRNVNPHYVGLERRSHGAGPPADTARPGPAPVAVR